MQVHYFAALPTHFSSVFTPTFDHFES